MRAVLDTHVFLSAAGASHPAKEPCARVLRRVAEGSLEATINSEVVQEILYLLAGRGRRGDGVVLARHVAALFPDLLPVTREDVLGACDLVQRYPKLSVRDAIHAASMLRNGLKRVISVDADFDQIRGIRRIEPDAA
ncbi:MAG: type II toxin-antitoxin system VapC family toxin, partial [Thermoanaerobaculia bacterium]